MEFTVNAEEQSHELSSATTSGTLSQDASTHSESSQSTHFGSGPTADAVDENPPPSPLAHGGCNICYDEAPTSPVVTYCGHIFCWECLHRWLGHQSKPCPVCRSMVRIGTNVLRLQEDPGRQSEADDPRAVVPARPNSPTSTRFPSQAEVLESSDILLIANGILRREQTRNVTGLRIEIRARQDELSQLQTWGSELLENPERAAAADGVMVAIMGRINELLDAAHESLQESQRIQQLLHNTVLMQNHLFRLRWFVRANRVRPEFWAATMDPDVNIDVLFRLDESRM